jgi:hypothetical protein
VIAQSQQRSFDCGVACLAMLCHVPYVDVHVIAAQVRGDRYRQGLLAKDAIVIAARLSRPLTLVHPKKIDLEEDCGLLGIKWNDRPRWADGHWVLLRRGTLIDPDGPGLRDATVWDAEEYFRTNKARPGYLLMERPS